MRDFKNAFLCGLLLCVMLSANVKAYAQEADDRTDSLYAARLMLDNLGLYRQADSLNLLIKGFKSKNAMQTRQVDSLKTEIAQLQANRVLSLTKVDTLETQRLRVKQELLAVKQQMLTLNTTLEQKLQLLRDQEFQLSDC